MNNQTYVVGYPNKKFSQKNERFMRSCEKILGLSFKEQFLLFTTYGLLNNLEIDRESRKIPGSVEIRYDNEKHLQVYEHIILAYYLRMIRAEHTLDNVLVDRHLMSKYFDHLFDLAQSSIDTLCNKELYSYKDGVSQKNEIKFIRDFNRVVADRLLEVIDHETE